MCYQEWDDNENEAPVAAEKSQPDEESHLGDKTPNRRRFKSVAPRRHGMPSIALLGHKTSLLWKEQTSTNLPQSQVRKVQANGETIGSSNKGLDNHQ